MIVAMLTSSIMMRAMMLMAVVPVMIHLAVSMVGDINNDVYDVDVVGVLVLLIGLRGGEYADCVGECVYGMLVMCVLMAASLCVMLYVVVLVAVVPLLLVMLVCAWRWRCWCCCGWC